jgi:hypothetical protein
MFESKWIIYSCITALIVGAAIISPLLILNTVNGTSQEDPPLTSLNPQSNDAQIGVNIKTAQMEYGTITTPIAINSTETVTQPAFSGNITVNATKYLNNNESIPLAESDLFLMQISTENGTIIRNCTLNIGTAYNESFTHEQQRMLNFSLISPPLIGASGGAGTFIWNWSIGASQENTQGFSGNITPDMAALIDSSQTLTMTISRIATFTARDNFVSVLITSGPPIETVTLTRSGNTFTYAA